MPRSIAPLLTMSEHRRTADRSATGRANGIAAAGNERDVDARYDGLVDGVDDWPSGMPPAAVEQRAVDVDANQANHGQTGRDSAGTVPTSDWVT